MVSEVRLEYVELAQHLEFLRGAFDLPCSPTQQRDVATTLAAFECIDRHYDVVGDAPARRALGAAVIGALRGETAIESRELQAQVDRLRAVFAAHRAIERCAELMRRFIDATERVRAARSAATYVAGVQDEGRLTSEMVLLLLEPERAVAFTRFFSALGVVANLVDKLCDVRRDHRAGEVALRPGVRVHARLVAAFVRGAVRVIAAFPERRALAMWGVRYLAPLVRGDRSAPAPAPEPALAPVPPRYDGGTGVY